MPKKSSLAIFSGTYGQMYAVAYLVWQNYEGRQKDFAKKNTKYTPELATQQQQAITNARKMPEVAVRRDFAKEARVILGTAALNCTDNWLSLGSLIENSFAEKVWDFRKGQAGYASYDAATHEQWDKVISLNTASAQFIADNTDALTTGGMLPGFPTEADGYQQAYGKLYTAFYAAKQAFEQQTTAKANASNAIYTTAIGMMADGKIIYKKDARTREEFIYSSLMKKVRGTGFTKTGINFKLRQPDKTPLLTPASVLFSNGQTARAGSKGTIRCDLPEGTYGFTLTADNYRPLTGTVKINAGTMHQKTVTLQKTAIGGIS